MADTVPVRFLVHVGRTAATCYRCPWVRQGTPDQTGPLALAHADKHTPPRENP